MKREPPLVILGVDPGTRVTGWGIVSVDAGEPRPVACDAITPHGRWAVERRLEYIFSELGDVIARFQPVVVAIEQPFVGANARSAMAVGEARTVAMLAAALAGLPVRHYPPATVRQAVAGYGGGDKLQLREMLRLQYRIDDLPENLDATDALAVALCHAAHERARDAIAASS
jgi:crossover junction endodeoxyribonuclease RuvC